MQLTLVTLLFLGVAVLVALGILYVVVAPRLRERARGSEEGQAAVQRRHTSRTGR